MSGLCSRHKHHEPGCRLCNTSPTDIFPNWEQKVAEAEAAGKHRCMGCGFVYYLTVNACPKCCRPAKPA